MSDSEHPGWGAIDDTLEAVYPGVKPAHWSVLIRYSLGGPDPLDGVSAYAADDPPHWHYVTYGFSELYEKTSENGEESGWGMELTFRLKRKPGEQGPPSWPVPMLQNLARYVFNSNRSFQDGHYIGGGSTPLTDVEETILMAMVFHTDPVLGAIETPHGRVCFIQAIGITADEFEWVFGNGGIEELLPRLLDGNPLGVTDIGRGSLLTA